MLITRMTFKIPSGSEPFRPMDLAVSETVDFQKLADDYANYSRIGITVDTERRGDQWFAAEIEYIFPIN